MAGLAFDVLMETGVLVHGLLLWPEELQRPETFSNPALIVNILREGVRPLAARAAYEFAESGLCVLQGP